MRSNFNAHGLSTIFARIVAALEQRACIYRPLFHMIYFGVCFSPKYDQKRFFTPFHQKRFFTLFSSAETSLATIFGFVLPVLSLLKDQISCQKQGCTKGVYYNISCISFQWDHITNF